MNAPNKEESLTLEILETIEKKSDITQRHIADNLGVALGLANSYLKRCVRKGLIKIKQAPANRYLYYLTPQGFAEKSRITAKFMSSSFDIYRKASVAYEGLMAECMHKNHKRVIFCGVSELAEIALLRAQETGVEVVGIYDPDAIKEIILGLPVWKTISDMTEADILVLTALNNIASVYKKINESDIGIKILVPEFLEYAIQVTEGEN